jgi:hypothetical protein
MPTRKSKLLSGACKKNGQNKQHGLVNWILQMYEKARLPIPSEKSIVVGDEMWREEAIKCVAQQRLPSKLRFLDSRKKRQQETNPPVGSANSILANLFFVRGCAYFVSLGPGSGRSNFGSGGARRRGGNFWSTA